MDISTLKSASETGAVCTIKNPETGKDTDIKIEMYGPESKQYRAAVLRINRESVKNRGSDKSADEMTDAELLKMLEDDDQQKVNLLVACTIGWEGLEEGKKKVEYSAEEAQRLYTDYVRLRNQLWAFVTEQSNFFIS